MSNQAIICTNCGNQDYRLFSFENGRCCCNSCHRAFSLDADSDSALKDVKKICRKIKKKKYDKAKKLAKKLEISRKHNHLYITTRRFAQVAEVEDNNSVFGENIGNIFSDSCFEAIGDGRSNNSVNDIESFKINSVIYTGNEKKDDDDKAFFKEKINEGYLKWKYENIGILVLWKTASDGNGWCYTYSKDEGWIGVSENFFAFLLFECKPDITASTIRKPGWIMYIIGAVILLLAIYGVMSLTGITDKIKLWNSSLDSRELSSGVDSESAYTAETSEAPVSVNGNGVNTDSVASETHLCQWVNSRILIEATESSEGSVEQVCSFCNSTRVILTDKKEHIHVFSEVYSYDSISHWHAALCGHSVT